MSGLHSEGITIGNLLFYSPPHPGLPPLKGVLKRVPGGEGIAPIIELRNFMSPESGMRNKRFGLRRRRVIKADFVAQ